MTEIEKAHGEAIEENVRRERIKGFNSPWAQMRAEKKIQRTTDNK